jgi:hypothetical protein
MTGRSPAAQVIKLAAAATAESKFKMLRTIVSSKTASANVPCTVSTGEPAV